MAHAAVRCISWEDVSNRAACLLDKLNQGLPGVTGAIAAGCPVCADAADVSLI